MKKKLCLCGCKQPATKGKKFTRGHKKIWEATWHYSCECGCGRCTTPNHKFIDGHENIGRKRKQSKNTIEKMLRTKAARGQIYRPKPKPTLCLCGCGNCASLDRKYIFGHSSIGRHPSPESIEKSLVTKISRGLVKPKEIPPDPTLCACGCGEYASSGFEFIAGHHTRGVGGYKLKVSGNCLCGCGQITNPGAKYIYGHSSRGRLQSLETRQKRSVACFATKGNKHDHVLHQYLACFQYKALLKEVKQRDLCCIVCGDSQYKNLCAHHVVPLKIGYNNKLCDDISNLVTVCKSCHTTIHSHGKSSLTDKWRNFLPEASRYLSKFKYSNLLLNTYVQEMTKK